MGHSKFVAQWIDEIRGSGRAYLFLGNLFRAFFFFPAVAMGQGSEDLVRVSAEFRPFDNDFLHLKNWSNDLRNSATAMECWHILNALYRGQSLQTTFPVLCWYTK